MLRGPPYEASEKVVLDCVWVRECVERGYVCEWEGGWMVSEEELAGGGGGEGGAGGGGGGGEEGM